ncbi:hypothetical protein [Shewanella psychrotolerans]|uniref:hypothetical protein n=1 Tax=Shewanella psychrotolerans TaxID=2864206 RepID=UPI001C654BC2|nr:hypothetical protein [Shewanella psychrotolerans]QYK03119.1 hypothetical protein K0I62_09465 [Shewanella psychrotolerans]
MSEIRRVGRVKHKHSRKKYTNYFYSYKSARHLWCEGRSEIDTALILEFDDAILSYSDQNLTFELEDPNGKLFTYTPDFVAFDLTVFDWVVIEAKTQFYQMTEEDIALLRWCFKTQHGKTFRHIVPENECTELRLKNYRTLYKYLKLCPTQVLPIVTAKILCGDALTFEDFRLALSQRNIDDAFAFSYLAHRLAVFDFDLPLNDLTIVEFI